MTECQLILNMLVFPREAIKEKRCGLFLHLARISLGYFQHFAKWNK